MHWRPSPGNAFGGCNLVLFAGRVILIPKSLAAFEGRGKTGKGKEKKRRKRGGKNTPEINFW